MNLAVKLLKFATRKGVAKVLAKEAKTAKGFVKFAKISAKIAQKESKLCVKYYVPKPGIKMPACPATLRRANPISPISKESLKGGLFAEADLGNVSLRLEKTFKKEKGAVTTLLNKVFPGSNLELRAKSSNSIFSKLKKVINNSDVVVKTDADARKIITDSVGGRITLPNLTEKDFLEVINNAVINGKTLTASEKSVIIKYFNGGVDKMTEAEIKTAKSIAKEVKVLLAERQSEPVYNQLMLGMMKDALNRKVTTIEKLAAEGINPKLLQELKTNPKIEPFRVTRLCNYRGIEGTAYFSDKQIRQIKRMQLATGEKFSVASCDADIDLAKYNLNLLDKDAKAAIKKSGYTTTQMNFVMGDGRIYELQITGEGSQLVYHPEHVKYDASQGKNTLSRLYDEYKAALSGLTAEQRKIYDKYFNDLYNTSRESIELMAKTKPPVLDSSLNRILSIENMIETEKKVKELTAHAYAGFKPYFAEVIDYAA